MAKSSSTKPSTAGRPDSKLAQKIRLDLLQWYRKHRRTLPWRSDQPVAYHVMVSEAMLQQTQVTTVIAYFQRFIEAFPTVQALAQADEQQVLTLWQGLGYYRRARGLHAAARLIVAEHGGVVPDSVEVLLTLPGVGRYTAGAIASIAYDKPEPIVDGNVARVLARLFAIDQPTNEPAVLKQIWILAQQLVSATAGGEGDFNQAMMELGAIICTPRSPSCLVCPLGRSCQALDRGLVEQLPVKVERKKPAAVAHHVVAVESKGEWFFEQRPSEGLWSNMWQMPAAQELAVMSEAAADDETQQQRVLSRWLEDTRAIKADVLQMVGCFKHQTTHKTITFTLWRALLKGRRPAVDLGGEAMQVTSWRALDDLVDLPMSNPQKRMAKMLAVKQCSVGGNDLD